ncbi:MAG: trigger factor [Oscillospiraceae bacterium]|nr:trigger factor [Oscillospiraceae bacterium]
MSLLEHKKLEDGKYEFTVGISPEDFAKAIDKVYHRENKKISIPGFRKGKAPRAVIERMYGDNFFFDEAIDSLLPEECKNAIEQAGIETIGRPEGEVTEASKENGAKVKFTVTLRPELKIGKYKGIAATKKVNTVEDDEVEHEVGDLREKGARMITVEDRAAQTGDIAVIDFEGFKKGVAFPGGKGENYELTLGSGQFIPGFEEQVVGHKAGEEFDINVKFPADYGAEELAGQDVVFKIKLHEIRFKELPALDDELAKDVSEFDTLDELKKSIRERLEKANEDRADEELENELVDQVAGTLEGDVPAVMVDDRIEEMVRDFDYRLRSQGMTVENYLKYTGLDLDGFRNSFREPAEKFVKSRLALEAVVRDAKLDVSAEEIDAEFKRMAEEYKMELDKLKELVTEADLKKDLAVKKAIDCIKQNAKVKTEKTTREQRTKEAAKKAEAAEKEKAAE